MPYTIEKHGGFWYVVGPRGEKKRHTYGRHESKTQARKQVIALKIAEGEKKGD